jgi:hypothetical protein
MSERDKSSSGTKTPSRDHLNLKGTFEHEINDDRFTTLSAHIRAANSEKIFNEYNN